MLRVLEDALIRASTHDMIVRTRTPVALYILNQKRAHLRDLERRFGVTITVETDDSLTGSNYHALERGELATGVRAPRARAGTSPRGLRRARPTKKISRSRKTPEVEEEVEIVEAEAAKTKAKPARAKASAKAARGEGETAARKASAAVGVAAVADAAASARRRQIGRHRRAATHR